MMTPTYARSAGSRTLVVSAMMLLAGTPAAGQTGTMQLGDAAELKRNRNEIAIGRLIRTDRGELGCVSNLAVAFREPRPGTTFWAAEFTILDPGRGAWTLAAENAAGAARSPRPATSGSQFR